MNESSLYRNTQRIWDKTLQLFLLLIVVTSLIVSLPITTGKPSSNSYNYKFTVNEDGFTWVNITFQSTESTGSSWVFVPKFSPWRNITLSGKIETLDLVDTKEIPEVDENYYFYQALKFDFVSTNSFQLNIQFNMTEGALIIEPRGIFFSPQIGFKEGTGKADILFPQDYTVEKAVASGKRTYELPEVKGSHSITYTLPENLMRLQIGFSTKKTSYDFVTLKEGIFDFEAVTRYKKYASEILELFVAVHKNFTELFNVNLTEVKAKFFVPEFDMLLSVGGYVPFTGQTMGEININIFFIRAVNGTIQIIALHELIHHFLWKAGLSPDYLLWFHEGTAQYVSIDAATELGYEGAEMERNRLEIGVSQLENDFSFLQYWTPQNQPLDAALYYVASYYIINELAKDYGGLDYYKRFFEKIQGVEFDPYEWKPNEWLAFYLSFAANASVDLKLKLWGFDIRLLYTGSKISPELIYEAEKAVDGLSPMFIPYNLIAKFLYQQALLRLERGDVDGANQLLEASISLANLAPFLTLLTLVAIFAIIVYILYKRTSEPGIELPPLPPDFEETST